MVWAPLSVRNLFWKQWMLERKGGPGGGRRKRGTRCTVDGTLCVCPVGGKPLTACTLHERSCWCRGFQVVTQ